MRESMWGIFVVGVGVALILLIYFFQGVTTTDEHNYYLLKETTEAAMMDAIDMTDYRINNVISINREKFVESFEIFTKKKEIFVFSIDKYQRYSYNEHRALGLRLWKRRQYL